MIELRNIHKSYGALTVLDGIDLTITQKEYVALIGASGSGKSTLMHLIGCLDRPNSGQYLLDGEDVLSLPPKALSRIRGNKIGFVFQGFQLLPKLSALENVALPLLLKSIPESKRRDRAACALSSVGLSDRMNHRPHQLSGGQQQRVAIARALIDDPPIILADEPTGNLDPDSTEEVLALMQKLNDKGHTLILITHNRAVARTAGRQILVRAGKLEDQSLIC